MASDLLQMQKNKSIDILLVFNALEAFGTEYTERNLLPNESITRTVSNHMGKNFLQICIGKSKTIVKSFTALISKDMYIRGHTHTNAAAAAATTTTTTTTATDNSDKKETSELVLEKC